MSDNEWISVNERLPEENGRYLVAIKTSANYECMVLQFVRGEWFLNVNVVYWMPVPEVPEE